MSKTYLLTLCPMEPYFFGNEKTFSFDPKTPEENRYFIRGERMPMQTTVLGALRYLLMPVKHANYRYTKDEFRRNSRIIGTSSFQISKTGQHFGVIERISPVFLVKDGAKFIRTPFDHDTAHTDAYHPMENYVSVQTELGERWYQPGFNPKEGLADSYMNAKDGKLMTVKEIFRPVVRVGQNKGLDKKAFFKRQFTMLNPGWAFGAYVTLDTEPLAQDMDAKVAFDALTAGTAVYMGQSKTPFIAHLSEETNTLTDTIKQHLRPGVQYCLGDSLVDGSIYNECVFAAVSLRDFRSYETRFTATDDNAGQFVGGITKDAILYRLVCAGSVLIPRDAASFQVYFDRGDCQKIGFNTTVTKEGE